MLGVDGACEAEDEALPEKHLACAVLEQALLDLKSHATCRVYNHNASEARLFCLRDFGAWARKRSFWCDIAGIHEPAFVAAAQRITTTVV